MRKSLVSLVLLAVALVACGGSSPKASKAGGSASGGGGGAAASGYCALAKQYQADSNEISNAFKNIDYSKPQSVARQLADAYRAIIPKFTKAYNDAVAAAPAQIRNDLKLLGAGVLRFLDALQKANYDFTKIGADASLTAQFSDPKWKAAADRVGRYGDANCGIPYTPAPRPTSSQPY